MTADQLTVLVDRACRGVASPTEAEQLRAGIAQLQQQAAGAEQRTARYRAAWQSARARAHHARCVLADYRVAADAQKAKQACDHRDPNRLGHRRDLATVCARGHVVSPPIFGPPPSEPRPHNSNTWQDQDTGERNVYCEDCPAYVDNIGDEDDATEWAERHQAEATAEDAAQP